MEDADYIHSAQYSANMEQQQADFNDYRNRRKREQPFSDWSGFMNNYWTLRACLDSLSKNPDTKDDRDFIAFCEAWKSQQLGTFDTVLIENLYHKLYRKPIFRENRIFKNLRGAFENSIKKLLNDQHYTKTFFEIE